MRFLCRGIELALLFAAVCSAQEAIQYREVAVSPDGQYAAWTKNTPQSRNSEIWLLALTKTGAAPARIGTSRTAHAEHSLAWSPDSKQFAFLSDAEKAGQLELYTSTVNGAPKKLTNLTGFLSTPEWSPDGTRIAVLFTANAIRLAGATEAAAKDTGVVEEKTYEQRILVVDARTGQGTMITPADTYVYEYDWSPSSDHFAFTAAKGNGDNNWWIAQLYTIAATGGDPAPVYKPTLQIANPRWSPDGKQIAFIEGLMSDEGSTGGDIFTIDEAGTGDPRNLTPLRHSSPSWLRWTPDGHILFSETVDGGSAIGSLDPASKEVETLWKGDEAIDVTASKDGKTTAAIRNSWSEPPAVWAGALNQWTQRTHDNDSLKPSWGRVEKLHWASDNFRVEGWLVYPVNYDPSKKYPMVVQVHGGPAAAKRPSWPGFFDMSVLSGKGYFVFFPNPRGSFGDGETFARGNVRDIGKGDLRDILLGVDQIIRTLPVDPDRLGITGWSYGGYMTMWAITQTRRFHAAVAGAGIANWQSYYGENQIDKWMIPYFGASVYQTPDIYARSSPITEIRKVKTPTLVLVGDSDEECPAPQSYEYWHALKTLGVETQLVVYPGEGHRIRKPENTRDVMDRTVNWFDVRLKPANP